MNNNLFNIKDNVVVITGGTGVLGRAIAKWPLKEPKSSSSAVRKKLDRKLLLTSAKQVACVSL